MTGSNRRNPKKSEDFFSVLARHAPTFRRAARIKTHDRSFRDATGEIPIRSSNARVMTGT